MKKGIKRFTSAVLCAALLLLAPAGVYAAGGLTELRTKTIDIAEDLSLVTTTNYNPGSGDNAAENYFVYRPGGSISPMVCYGNDINGAASANRVFTLEKEAGRHPIGLVNGDFFVMATGVSLGPVVKNGIYRTGGYSESIVAFDKEGRVKFGDPKLNTELYVEPISVEVPIYQDPEDASQLPEGLGGLEAESPAENAEPVIIGYETVDYDPFSFGMQSFNKSISKSSGIVIFNKDFGSTNGSSVETFNIVVSIEEGEFVLGQTVKGTVEKTETVNGKTKLEAGMIYICMPADTKYATTLEKLKTVAPGSYVELRIKADEEFLDTENALGFEAWLVKDGEVVSGLDKSTRAPRTAAGIMPDGTFILYTVDGRQKSYSMGFTYKELAERMAELGCVQAVNLDGGASTQLFAQLPGEATNKQLNKDSDANGLRSCGNYIVFTNSDKPTGTAANLHIYPYGEYILSGAKLKLSCLATDAGYYPVSVPEGIQYSVDKKNGTVDETGLYTSKGSGEVRISAAAGKAKGSAVINVIESPDSIKAYINGKAAQKNLTATIGKEYKLSAEAVYKMMPLASDPECYTWEVTGDIGSIIDGVYYPEGVSDAEGAIVVTAGKTSVVIPVVLTRDLPVESIQQMIREMVSRVRESQMPVDSEE